MLENNFLLIKKSTYENTEQKTLYYKKRRILRPDDGRSISRNVAHLNILVHDMINLLL